MEARQPVIDLDGVMVDSETEVRATGHGRKEEQEGWRSDSQSLIVMGFWWTRCPWASRCRWIRNNRGGKSRSWGNVAEQVG